MPAMPAFRSFFAFALLALSACDCEPPNEPSDPEVGSESTDTGSETSTGETETGTDTNAESGEGSGGAAECVAEFFTCKKGSADLVCLTCPSDDLVPCSCLDAEQNVVVCYVFDASLC